jgi:hypothetical protein
MNCPFGSAYDNNRLYFLVLYQCFMIQNNILPAQTDACAILSVVRLLVVASGS